MSLICFDTTITEATVCFQKNSNEDSSGLCGERLIVQIESCEEAVMCERYIHGSISQETPQIPKELFLFYATNLLHGRYNCFLSKISESERDKIVDSTALKKSVTQDFPQSGKRKHTTCLRKSSNRYFYIDLLI